MATMTLAAVAVVVAFAAVTYTTGIVAEEIGAAAPMASMSGRCARTFARHKVIEKRDTRILRKGIACIGTLPGYRRW
jgi:hypothetical protein